MSSKASTGIRPENWQSLVDLLRDSPNPFERNAIYFGVVAADGSPILVDRSQLCQHAHYLGATGGGKSSLGLAPLIEQLVSFGDSTIIILDLKGDTNELLAAARNSRDHLEKQKGVSIPIKHFTIENGKATCVLSTLGTEQWLHLTELQRTDVIAAACGLVYGTDYARAFFSAANSQIIYAAERLSAGERNFTTLLRDVVRLLKGKEGKDLPNELRRSGVHAYAVMNRLAAIKQINVSPSEMNGLNAIDLGDCFRTPQIVYFKLPSTISQETTGAVGRLVAYFLMTAAHQVSSRRQVYLIVDEFQRMAAESLAILFEQARSLDLSLILSNQSLDDLGKHQSSLLNVIETNCNTRQWFSINTKNDIKSVEAIGCLREVDEVSTSTRIGKDGTETNQTIRRALLPRISARDAMYISNDPHLSLLRLTGVRRGYSQYRGLPFVARTGFHITAEEYTKRRAYQWPDVGDGMIAATEVPPPSLAERTDDRKQTDFRHPTFRQEKTDQSTIELSEWNPEGF